MNEPRLMVLCYEGCRIITDMDNTLCGLLMSAIQDDGESEDQVINFEIE